MRIKQLRSTVLASMCAVALFTSCSSDDNSSNGGGEVVKPGGTKDFQMVFANGTGSSSGTLLQGLKDISKGDISFSNKGYQVKSARTARVYASTDGATIYSLNYTVGTIDKIAYKGNAVYNVVGTIDASIPLGSKSVRFTKMNDKVGSVHNITQKALYGGADNKQYLKHEMTLSLGILDLETMSFGANFDKAIDLKLPEALATAGYYISRIDAPVVSGNKIYYGTAVSKFNASTGKNDPTAKAMTLVLDYPTLKNATVIETEHVTGSSNGYRTPTQHMDEKGNILQMVSNGKDLNIVKLVNGKYDTSFKYDVSQLLGRSAQSNGWFYAGNGIGYIPYEKVGDEQVQSGVNPQGEPTFSAPWGLARIDLNNNSIVNLEVPGKLWLRDYQNSVVRDGKFYIALASVGGKGNVYVFDVNSTNAKGTLGATITAGADQYYIGIF